MRVLASVALFGVGVSLASGGFLMAAFCYGAVISLHTLARGVLPLVLFDPTDYAAFMGRLAFPSLLVQRRSHPRLGRGCYTVTGH